MSIQSLSMTSDLILVSEEAVSRKELLNKLSRLLHSKGYVKSSFEEARFRGRTNILRVCKPG